VLKSGNFDFPRGILERQLGDGLQHSRCQRRSPDQDLAAGKPGRPARKGYFHQHAPRDIQGSSRSRRARPRLRFRMVEQEAVLRPLYADHELLRKLRHEATGKPSPEELALLDPYKDKLSPEVFGDPIRRR